MMVFIKVKEFYLKDGLNTIEETPFSRGNYGRHWWLPGDKFKQVPKDTYLALGHEDQIVAVWLFLTKI